MAEDMQSVEIRQNGPLIGLDFERAVNQESISRVAVYARDTDKNKDFVFIRPAVSLFFFSLFVSSLIKGAVGGFIYRRAPAAGRCRLNVLLMEQIMSKTRFFQSSRRGWKADEKVEEENFQQNTALPQIYPWACLHTIAYRKINALGPRQLS